MPRERSAGEPAAPKPRRKNARRPVAERDWLYLDEIAADLEVSMTTVHTWRKLPDDPLPAFAVGCVVRVQKDLYVAWRQRRTAAPAVPVAAPAAKFKLPPMQIVKPRGY